jgi:hypothetical protein
MVNALQLLLSPGQLFLCVCVRLGKLVSQLQNEKIPTFVSCPRFQPTISSSPADDFEFGTQQEREERTGHAQRVIAMASASCTSRM